MSHQSEADAAGKKRYIAAAVAAFADANQRAAEDEKRAPQEVHVLSEPIAHPDEYHVPYVQITHIDGFRLSHPIRCF